MAECLKINIDADKCSLYVFETTGKYLASCNKGGWGHPNAKTADVIKAEMHVYLPKSTVPVVINVYPDFPTDENIGYEITSTDLGVEFLTSGIYRVDYVVTLKNNEILTVSQTVLLLDDLKCQLMDMICSLDKCDPESSDSKLAIKLTNGLASAKLAAQCGCCDEAQKIVDYLYNQLKCNCHVC